MRAGLIVILFLALLAGLVLIVVQPGKQDPSPEPTDPVIALLAGARVELLGQPRSPSSGRAPLAAARKHLSAGRPEHARELILGELQGAWSAEAYYLLGILESRARLWQKAVEALERSLAPGARYPEKSIAPFRLGRALEETGRIPAARVAYRLDHDLSGDGEALFRLGLLDIEAGQFAQAKTRLEDALRRFTQDPDRARTLAALSDICLEGDDLAGARQLLEEAVALRPHSELLHRLARVCRRMGDGEAADRHTLAAQGLQGG